MLNGNDGLVASHRNQWNHKVSERFRNPEGKDQDSHHSATRAQSGVRCTKTVLKAYVTGGNRVLL